MANDFAILFSMSLPKLIAIVGPTGSGKSAFAHKVAKAFNGEIVCTDSRQIYRGLDIGSAKDKGEGREVDGEECYMSEGVREHLVDVLDPSKEWSVSEYQGFTFSVVAEIMKHGRLPVLVGGTGLYVQAVLENLLFPDVAPNPELRAQLERKSLEDLVATYAACDPVGALSIDENNRRRLIRAIEVCWVARRPFSELQIKGPKKYDAIQIAFDVPRETLFARLDHRVLQMIEEGLVEEVRALMDRGVDTWSQALSGIGYREVVQFLQGEINEQAMVAAIQKSTRALAKRQLTWFRRDSSVHWIRSEEEGMRLVKEFLEDE